jgi:hypothetical protein
MDHPAACTRQKLGIVLWPISQKSASAASLIPPAPDGSAGPGRELLTVAGRPVVEAGRLRTADPVTLARDLRAAARGLAGRH